jgi:hypothetical protein
MKTLFISILLLINLISFGQLKKSPNKFATQYDVYSAFKIFSDSVITIGDIVNDGDTFAIDMGAVLKPLNLSVNSASKFSVDSTGKVVTAGTINNQTISSSANFTGTLTTVGAITNTKDGDNIILDATTDLHCIDVQVNSASKFNVDSTGKVTSAGLITSSAGVNLGTSQALVGTTALTIGDNTQTIAVNSSGWDISSTGAVSGLTTISGSGALQLSKDGDTTTIDMGTVLNPFDLRVGGAWKARIDSTGILNTAGQIKSANGVDLGTSKALTGTTALTIGDNGQTVGINSSDWDISTTGVMTGIGNITSDGTFNGLTIANAIPQLVTTATAAADTTSAGALLSAVTQFVTVTSGSAAYKLMLPAASSTTIGLIITGFVGANGMKLRVAASQSGTVYLNNTVTNKQATIPAQSLFKVTCLSATQWLLTATDYAGAAVATITPASY